jgi:hypothetical protein
MGNIVNHIGNGFFAHRHATITSTRLHSSNPSAKYSSTSWSSTCPLFSAMPLANFTIASSLRSKDADPPLILLEHLSFSCFNKFYIKNLLNLLTSLFFIRLIVCSFKTPSVINRTEICRQKQ